MATEAPLTPEVAREYHRRTQAGEAPGRDTLERARSSVAASAASAVKGAASGAAKGAAVGGGPEDVPADVAGAAVGAARSVGRTARSAGSTAVSGAQKAYPKVNSPGAATKTVTRIVWAIALGLIALEIASEATGQFWNFNLKGPAIQKEAYSPLYSGQSLIGSPLPSSAIPSAAPVPLSNRSAGNQSL